MSRSELLANPEKRLKMSNSVESSTSAFNEEMVTFSGLVHDFKNICGPKDKDEDHSIEYTFGMLVLKMLNQEDPKQARKMRNAIQKLLIEEDSDEEMA